MLQWFSARCWPLIGWFIYNHYLPNHSSYCFHDGTLNSPKWPSDLISIPPCSVIFCRMLVADLSIGSCSLSQQLLIVLLSYWNCERLNGPDNLLTYCPASAIFCQMTASDWSIGLQPCLHNHSLYCFHIQTVNSPHWVSQLINIPSVTYSDFLLPQTKSRTWHGSLTHWMLVAAGGCSGAHKALRCHVSCEHISAVIYCQLSQILQQIQQLKLEGCYEILWNSPGFFVEKNDSKSLNFCLASLVLSSNIIA